MIYNNRYWKMYTCYFFPERKITIWPSCEMFLIFWFVANVSLVLGDVLYINT